MPENGGVAGYFPCCPSKSGATGSEVPFHHKCSSRQSFWGGEGSLPEFSQTSPKRFLCNFCLQNSLPQRKVLLFFGVTSKKVFMCFSANLGCHFLESGNFWWHFYPDFKQSNLLGYVCTHCIPTSNTTAFHKNIVGNFVVYQDRLEINLL